jgi:hypothetical protein
MTVMVGLSYHNRSFSNFKGANGWWGEGKKMDGKKMKTTRKDQYQREQTERNREGKFFVR